MNRLEIAMALLAFGSLGVLLVAYLVLFFRVSRTRPSSSTLSPGVTVLKPLKGADEGLRENLLAIINQDYPNFEIIFSAVDPQDPGLDVARALALSHPHRDIQVLVGEWNSGLNPKVRLLRRMLPSASHDLILVSDSNVRPGPGYLSAMVARAEQTGAALVHSLLAGVDGRGLGGRLEELHLSSWVAAAISFSDACGYPCVIGKSMLMRLDALSAVGGFAGVQDILAEDYILGSRFVRAGYRVALSTHRLPVVAGRCLGQNFWNRHVRWGQMRRRIAPFFYVAELAVNPTPFFIALICVSQGTLQLAGFAGLAMKWSADVLIYRRCAPQASWQTAAFVGLKDLLLPMLWAVGFVKRTVNWRGHFLTVGRGSRLYPLEHSPRRKLVLSDRRTVEA